MSTDELIVEARARIIWGDEPAAVHYFLTSNGMPTAEADSKIQDFFTERTKEIRKAGVRDAVLGATIVCACTSFIYYELKHPSTLFPSRQGRAMFFTGVIGLYGIWKLVNGLIYLVRPKSEKRSITEPSQ